VLLRVDGGLKTGWDVVMGALMGAEEFGFGSIAMIAEGCIMARVCHTNNCPVGVATQKEELRKRFTGCPSMWLTSSTLWRKRCDRCWPTWGIANSQTLPDAPIC
jgi:glutamate synthase domain-containing protein 2